MGPAVPEWTGSRLFLSASNPSRLIKSDAALRAAFGKKRPAFRAPFLVGVFGFEAGRLFDRGLARLPRKADPLSFPAVSFGDYSDVVEIDYKKRRTAVWSNNPKIVARVKQLLAAPLPRFAPARAGRFKIPPLARFSRMIGAAKKAIAGGDIYQANLSLRFSAPYRGEPFSLYEALSRRNPSAYACLIKMGPEWIVSTSPELLVRVEAGRAVTRPIAGTRPRGKTSREDSRRRGQLLVSPKERAEHIMLVDLERNDLGRVCSPGSVRVTERFGVERYSHVMHIVSEVRGKLMKNKNAYDALSALFPGGTITGCPKIKSVEIIQGLEGVSRGPFYGSAGFFTGDGDAVFNILIRTALVRRGKIHVQAGAGIVADSNARREYRETLAKARVLLELA